jgi:hypothetical protein
MRGRDLRKSCVTCFLMFLVLVLCRRHCVVSRRKNGGLLYFEVNPHHSFATKVNKWRKVNSKIAIQPRHLIFCLGICLDLLARPSCLVQDVITKSKASYPQVDGVKVKVNGVDQPINLAISFAQDEITQIQGHR